MLIENQYQYIYLFVATIFLIVFLGKQQLPRIIKSDNNQISFLCILVVAVLTHIIGNRPSQVGADTVQYMGDYEYVKGIPFEYNKDAENFIFDNLFAYMGSLNLDIHAVFILMAFIYFGCMYIACRKLFPQNQEVAFFSYLVAFSTFSYGVNGMKAGAGASLFLVALAYKEIRWLSATLVVLSVGVHHSMIVVAVAYIVGFFYKNTKIFFYGWILSFLLAAAHITIFQNIFAGFADEKGKDYLMGKGFVTGFRIDFIIYSLMPILIGYMMLFKKKVKDETYELWLRMYMVTNSVWMLCMYASYTNRIAYLSWFMYPIVLFMPFYAIRTIRNQMSVGKIVVLCHLGFTIFMTVVYYGLFR